MKKYIINENGLNMVFAVTDENEVKLLHFSALPFHEEDITAQNGWLGFRLVEVMVSGLDRPGERHGTKYIVTAPGYRLKYRTHNDYRNEKGRKLEIVTFDEETGLDVISHFQFFDGISVVRSWTEVKNVGEEAQGLEYVSSFALTGIEKEGLLPRDEKMEVWIPHNSWQREMQWERYSFPQLGLAQSQPVETQRSSKVIGATNTGNWSTKEYLPMGYLANRETKSNLFWQIEHNGSWHWEISDQEGHFYLQLSGPTETESHWWKNLKPGETFVTVPVSVGSTLGEFDEAMGELTRYRRAIRRKNEDNERLCVIFNDYMNCLWGNPTSEKEWPLIDAAARAGCEYFCVDAGWYSAGFWWDNVGEWLPSYERFPNGLEEVMDAIRAKGMIPGVWLEIEVMGIKCPKAARVHPDWFFTRHGKKVHDRSRWQLDFRNPEVIAHANEVIDRLVNQYHVGYIKMDYNIEPGIGTELNADSVGDGLLGHERAYLAWLDSVFARYPDLIIENCSSGGLRIDYAMLSRYSIQSTSDQEDYLHYATIAANAPAGLTPEQSAIWSYPMNGGNREEAIFNMVNAVLMRIHQSGHLANISEERFQLVKEALDYYKTIRQDIKNALPFWPLGLSQFADTWVSMGLKAGKKTYLAVWRRNASESQCVLPLRHLKGCEDVKVRCAYPEADPDTRFHWNSAAGTLTVDLPAPICARVFELECGE
ncbi:MAG TPA: alpha-galactosidase [Candidatus Gallacutalibacter pullistercoris]|nr:alpha-galactosidase [Candidatus Gallacutalibacter pullistercoris]